jgi:hypothetical protein
MSMPFTSYNPQKLDNTIAIWQKMISILLMHKLIPHSIVSDNGHRRTY